MVEGGREVGREEGIERGEGREGEVSAVDIGVEESESQREGERKG